MKNLTIPDHKHATRLMRLPMLWLATVLMAMIPAAHADIYTWQDKNGVIHFSNQDAPPNAGLYMREPAPVPTAAADKPQSSPNDQVETDPAAIRRQIRTEIKLEEANRKLDAALDRVSELTEKVAQSQSRADAAAEQARLAALEAERQATAAEDLRERDNRTVVYAVPVGRRYLKHSPHYRGPYSPGPNKKLRPKKHARPSKIVSPGKLNADRRFNRHGYAPVPVLPPESEYIPSAYGVRVRSRIPAAYGIR